MCGENLIYNYKTVNKCKIIIAAQNGTKHNLRQLKVTILKSSKRYFFYSNISCNNFLILNVEFQYD